MTLRDRADLDRAEEVLIARCMADQGFRYTPRPETKAASPGEYPFGIDDLAWARVHGYGLTEQRAEQEAAERPVLQYVQSLPVEMQAGYARALNGSDPGGLSVDLPNGAVVTTSTDGCRAVAEARLYGDHARWFRAHAFVLNLTTEINARVEGNPRYLEVIRSWSGCMAAAVHPYESPGAVRSEIAQRLMTAETLSTVHQQEVTLAVAEAGCARKTGLVTVARQLQARYTPEVRGLWREQVVTDLEMQRAALPRARDLR